MCSRYTILVLTLLVYSLSDQPIHAGPYVFERVAVINRQAPGINDPIPSINNAGQVAFYGRSASLPLGLYVGNAGGIAPIFTPPTGQGIQFGDYPVINSSGQVAYETFALLSSDGVYVGSTSGITTVVDMQHSGQFRSYGHSLADDGTLYLSSFYDPIPFNEPSVKYIHQWNASGPLSQLDTLTQPPLSAFFDIATTASSDNGALAYAWQSPNLLQRQIVRVQDGIRTVVATTNVPGQFESFAINNDGLVALVAPADAFGSRKGVYLADGITTKQVALTDIQGPFNRLGNVSINNDGSLAFLAGLLDGGDYTNPPGSGGSGGLGGGQEYVERWEGLFTGPDLEDDLVIRTGQLLDGLRLSTLRFGTNGLNDLGQIAFYAEFTDGSAAQYIATPVAVPEPSSLTLAAGAALGALVVSLRRHRFRR